ncbi:hypothetical protein RRG08_059278 [Elysia crispata]|uniref:Integrase catalytic domain-containing protein n=1 Tax=Elysia crispata TaxID=231223 RepID=A0AAE1E794_9GAST|nr:hypothetical protein RRG08_059278 [Elysia crispata]
MPDPNDCGPIDISVPLRSLPCGGCGHCTRVHRKWTEFSEDVDDVVPISVTARQIVSSSANGEMMVDQFTKWVGCIPLPSQTAEHTATAAVNEFFSRFGCSLHIFTDQGRNCERLKIQKYRITQYHQSSNGQVERFNRTLINAVRCYLTDRQDRWDNCVPQRAAAIRASVNRHTGFTPNKLLLGREVNMLLELVFAQSVPTQADLPIENYVAQLQQDILDSNQQAREIADHPDHVPQHHMGRYPPEVRRLV